MLKSDTGIGIALILVSTFFFVDSFAIRQSTISAPMASASFFPRVVSVLLIVSCIWMIGRDIVRKRKAGSAQSAAAVPDAQENAEPQGSEKYAVYMIVATLAYIFIIPILGYLVTTIVYMVVSCLFLGNKFVKKRWITVLIAIAISASAFLLFNLVLSVFLPSGLLI